jgi:hypothetical protein
MDFEVKDLRPAELAARYGVLEFKPHLRSHAAATFKEGFRWAVSPTLVSDLLWPCSHNEVDDFDERWIMPRGGHEGFQNVGISDDKRDNPRYDNAARDYI